MMNNKLLLAAGAATLSASFFATTATAATDTANASATVLTPLSIIADVGAEMDFGDVAGDVTDPTTVVLTTGGTTSSPDGASTAGTPSAGNFDVTGSGTLAYDITLPADGVVQLTGGGAPMDVDGFTDSAGGTSSLTAGTDTFDVGATLTINANQTAGPYTGTYDVTVNYQ
ncbi:MAG: DUF4402 domain-containing protein [Gammaproteobacteria bacterium]|nr:DUF4402 domain-containing protein [Gammaproteobacteria bacterium]